MVRASALRTRHILQDVISVSPLVEHYAVVVVAGGIEQAVAVHSGFSSSGHISE